MKDQVHCMGRCPLCDRALIDGPSVNAHHLAPRSYRGKEAVRMRRICHNKVHSVLSERELVHYYRTCERLLESAEIRKFVSRVKKKEPAYYDSHRASLRSD
jgi:hypothetical protein